MPDDHGVPFRIAKRREVPVVGMLYLVRCEILLSQLFQIACKIIHGEENGEALRLRLSILSRHNPKHEGDCALRQTAIEAALPLVRHSDAELLGVPPGRLCRVIGREKDRAYILQIGRHKLLDSALLNYAHGDSSYSSDTLDMMTLPA